MNKVIQCVNKMERPACPEKVKIRAAALYCNGFTGFQEPDGGGKDCFVVCMFDDEKLIVDLEEIKKEAKSETLVNDDWIGRDYLRIHWTEHNRIPLVLNTLLKRGHSFQAMTKGMPFFDAKKDHEFSIVALEKKSMTQVSELLGYRLITMINDAYLEPWNYVTEEGKAFAKSLREDPLLSHRYDTERTNFYEWDLFTEPYDKETLV